MKRNDRFKIILVVMAVLICVLLFVVGYLIGDAHGRKAAALSDVSQDRELRDTVVNKDNVNRVSKDLDKQARKSPGSYEVIMNTEWVFNGSGMEAGNAYIENGRDNTNTVRFLLSLEDKPDEILYTSDEIPVGDRISGIMLKKPVPSGRNKAVVTYQLLDEEGSVLGEVKAGVMLVYEDAGK